MGTDNTAVMYVTHQLLLEVLGLPADMRIIGIGQSLEDVLNGTFQIVVEHPGLPQRVAGASPRVMTLEALTQAVTV